MQPTKPERRGLFAWLRGEENRPAAPGAEEQARVEPVAPQQALSKRLEDEGELGRGGMSSVRRVLDHNLFRRVAMKVLDPTVAQDPVEVARFWEEAQITGQLEHPYVPPVYEVGSEGGVHYFTMKLVRGQTLDQLIHAPEFSPEKSEQLDRALEVFVKVCEAVAYAHSRGVIHLDLKPANVMVGKHGQVYVMDWGLARLVSQAPPMPGALPPGRPSIGRAAYGRTGGYARVQLSRPAAPLPEDRVAGTANYMSPEQAQGLDGKLDPRSDVFSLGAVLYAILTGRPPYTGEDPEAVFRLAQAGQVAEPEQVCPARLPAKLCRVAMRALRREQAERYATAAELGEAVEDYLLGHGRHPVVRYPAGAQIFTQGAPGEAVYVVVSGRCRVFRTVDGQKRTLRELGPGDSFGEVSTVTRGTRTASVEALEPVAVMMVAREELEQELARGPWLGPIVRGLAGRYREADAQAQRHADAAQRHAEQARQAGFAQELLLLFALHCTGTGSLRQARWSEVAAQLARRLGLPAPEVLAQARRLDFVAVDLENDKLLVLLPPTPVASGRG